MMTSLLCAGLVTIPAAFFWASYFLTSAANPVDKDTYQKNIGIDADNSIVKSFAIAFSAIAVALWVITIFLKFAQ